MINTESENFLENSDNEIRDRIRENFFFDIAVYLTKKEKIHLREISKCFEKEIFSQLKIDVFLKKSSESEEYNNNNLDLKKIMRFYQNMEKLKIESIKINKRNFELIQAILKQNSNSIKILHLMNIEFDEYSFIEDMYDLINSLNKITEISIGGIGNRDRLFLHIEKNKKCLSFKDNIKVLTIDNLPLAQIQFLLFYFKQNTEILISNCSLDEDISHLIPLLTENPKVKINLPLNGFSTNTALESIRTIIKHHRDLKELCLKGIWFKSIHTLFTESMSMTNLEILDLGGSKYLFTETNINSTEFLQNLPQLKILNLSDSRMRVNNLDVLLKNLNINVSNTLHELNFMKNMFNSDCFEVLSHHLEKLQSVKVLNIAFNPHIGEKGFRDFAELSDKFKLSHIDFRGCGIFFKLVQNSFKIILFKKNHSISRLDFYYNTLKDSDYVAFVKEIFNELSNSKSSPISLNIKIFFKFKFNQDLLNKLESTLEILYKKYNLLIR